MNSIKISPISSATKISKLFEKNTSTSNLKFFPTAPNVQGLNKVTYPTNSSKSFMNSTSIKPISSSTSTSSTKKPRKPRAPKTEKTPSATKKVPAKRGAKRKNEEIDAEDAKDTSTFLDYPHDKWMDIIKNPKVSEDNRNKVSRVMP